MWSWIELEKKSMSRGPMCEAGSATDFETDMVTLWYVSGFVGKEVGLVVRS